ncbi:MAG: hypothetical protein HY791_36295 [Deltaproteobacteria bacterium]|nr:hypothetical protein [Deltaproteobacteria bacterium]
MDWSQGGKAEWLKKAKKALHAGDIHEVERLILSLAPTPTDGSEGEKSNAPYFTRNAHRMRYADFKRSKLVIGSGSVESSVRRIVNLRMKGNGTFWNRENAEGMLLIRSYLKAGRLDDLADWSLQQTTPWWTAAKQQLSGPLPEARRIQLAAS